MRMSRGWSDGKSTNQALEIPRTHASLRIPSVQSNYYNRLEYHRWFRLLYAAARFIQRLLAMLRWRSSRVVPGAPLLLSKPQAFLSLVQVRKSCHKQVWGVTPFRRGIA
jgi:hypothetical protein